MKYIILMMLLCTQLIFSQQIALTFDDAPKSGSNYLSGMERTKLLIQKLDSLGINQVGFFCNSSRIDSTGNKRLSMYAEAGHVIANHSHSHPSLNEITAHQFINDILIADSILSTYKNFRKYFRFPFLHEGNTAEKRDSVRKALRDNGYINGYVTVDTYDWYIDGKFKTAIKEKQEIDFDQLGELYVDHLWESIKFYDNIAKETLGRSPKHVLLLHENDCAVLFLDKLVDKLRVNGWQIIGIDEAYSDPIAKTEPNTLFNNQGKVAAVANEAGVERRRLVQNSEDNDYLDDQFDKMKIFMK